MRLIETETSVPWVVTSRSIRMNPLRRVVSASIRGLVLSLTLAAIHYAARWVDAQEEPGNSIPTLLTTPLSQDQPDSGAAGAAPRPRRSVDEAAKPALFPSVQSTPAERVPANAGDLSPTVEALPTQTIAQGNASQAAQPPASARRANPVQRQTPAPPGQRTSPPPNRPASPTTPGQPDPNRPAANAEQQVQFDPNGLVTMHTNELEVRQLLELLSSAGGPTS